MEEPKFVPTELTAVASEKLKKEVAEDLKKKDPEQKSMAKFIQEYEPVFEDTND